MVVCTFLWSSPAKANTYIFSGGGAWTNTALWSPSYPGTTIATGDTAITHGYCFFNSGGPTLVNNGVIRVAGGELATFGTPFHNYGQVSVESGGNISQILTNKSGGLVTVASGFLSNLVNESGATCNIAAGSGMSRFDNAGTITNSGSISISNNTSKVQAGGILYNYSQLYINDYGRLELQSGGTINCSSLGEIHGSSGSQTDSLILMGGSLITTGLVENVTLGVRSSSTASFSTTGCAVRVFAGRTLTISSGSTFTLTGNNWEIYGTLINNGIIEQAGPFAFSFIRGYLSGSFINNNQCQIGELELNDNSSCTNNEVLQTEKLEIANSASLTNNDQLDVTSQMFMSGTSPTLKNYKNLVLQGTDFYHNDGILTNYAPNGDILVSAGSNWFIRGAVVNHDHIVNQGVIDGNNEIGTTAFSNYGIIENTASFETPKTFTNHVGSTFENYGIYINTDFNNNFINKGTFNNYSGATFQNESFGGGGANLAGGIFNQNGTFDQRSSSLVYGPLTNNGLITNGDTQGHNGCPIFADSIICAPTGTFRVKVAQPLNGCNIGYHDNFTIQDPIFLDGTLEVMSNQITQDHISTVIEASQVVGTFSNVIWPVIPGMYFEILYSATRVRLHYSTTPLPIELTHFEAKKQDAYVLLAWKTATEAENKGFAIERSTDGRAFSEIGYVRGAGTAAVSTAYRYEDKILPASPVLYYRLRQEDADGKGYTYSPIRSVNLPLRCLAEIVPNPSKGNVSLRINSDEEAMYSFRIVDSQGRVVKKMPEAAVSKGEQALPMDMFGLPAGVYWLHLQSERHAQWLRIVLE